MKTLICWMIFIGALYIVFACFKAPSQAVSPEHSSGSNESSFGGDECLSDCSGHQAGFDWAKEKGIDDENDCDAAGDRSNSPSFADGCKAYVNGEGAPDDDDNDDDSDRGSLDHSSQTMSARRPSRGEIERTNIMKKLEMTPPQITRGKYTNLLKQGSNIAVLDPSLLPHFPTSESVNRALHAFVAIRKQVDLAKAPPRRRATRQFDPRVGTGTAK